MEVDDIISYHNLLTKERAALQKGGGDNLLGEAEFAIPPVELVRPFVGASASAYACE